MLSQRMLRNSDAFRVEHRNDTPGASGVLAVDVDLAKGTMQTIGSGFWSLAQAHAFFEGWVDSVERIHAAGRPVRAIVDLRQSAVQPPDVVAVIETATRTLYREDDRIAMVVPTSLMKIQMRRILDPRCHDFFLSYSAAKTWMSAWSI